MLRDITPLTVDCGTACGGRCCQPSCDREGMLLFPGEERLYENTEFDLRQTEDGVLLTCSGSCDRDMRPLACRIFPLLPVLDEKGRVRAAYDPRGWRLCPLLLEADRVALSRRFVRAVRRAGRILMRDPACEEFLREQGAQAELFTKLLPLHNTRAPIKRRKVFE